MKASIRTEEHAQTTALVTQQAYTTYSLMVGPTQYWYSTDREEIDAMVNAINDALAAQETSDAPE